MSKYLTLKNRDWLYHQYVTSDKTQLEIAHEIGSSRCPVYYWIKKHKISVPNRQRTEKKCKKLRLKLQGNKNGQNHKMSKVLRERLSQDRSGAGNPMHGVHLSKETKKKLRQIFSKRTGTKNPNWKGGKPCCFDCGQELSDYGSIRCQECNGKSHSGKNSPSWKGGKSNTAGRRTSSSSWMRLAKKIRQRDSYTCQRCGKKPVYDVHHIIPYNLSGDDSPDNLTTLCQHCHGSIDGKLRSRITTTRLKPSKKVCVEMLINA